MRQVSSPAPSADGTRPERPQMGERQITDEQKSQIEAARTACEDLAPNLGGNVGPLGGGGPGGFGHGGPGGPIGRPSGGSTGTV